MVDLQTIFDRCEAFSTQKNYKYSEQEAINGKPSIMKLGENLKRFPLSITLHSSFCDIDEVIKAIEQKAENGEVISYFRQNVYIGEYVIEAYSINMQKVYNGIPVLAELTLDLLETQEEKTFTEQLKTKVNLSSSTTLKSTAPKIQKIKKDLEKKAVEQSFNDAVMAITIGNLTDAEKLITNNLAQALWEEIKLAGIGEMFEVTKDFTKNITVLQALTQEQKERLQNALNSIPTKVLRNVLR